MFDQFLSASELFVLQENVPRFSAQASPQAGEDCFLPGASSQLTTGMYQPQASEQVQWRVAAGVGKILNYLFLCCFK